MASRSEFMTFRSAAMLASAGTVLLGLALTHPLELRNGRWLRVLISIPLVVCVTSAFYELGPVRGYFAMFFIAALAFIWKGPAAHFGAVLFVRALQGDLNRATGVRASFHGAKALRKHGDLREAIQLTRAELEKEPLNYEGLLLLSELVEETQGPKRAIAPLEKLLEAGALTADQRRLVQARKQQLERGKALRRMNG